MKRLFSIVMALILMLSLSITVFADANTNTNTNTNTPDGSITITNPTKEHTYKLYKIFDATYSSTGAVSYTIEEDSQFFPSLFGDNEENDYFTYDPDNGYVERKKDTLPGDIIAYLADMVQKGSYKEVDSITADSGTIINGAITFENLPYGYYLIDKGTKAAVTITSNTPNVEVIDKNQIPGTGFSKLIKDEETETWVSDSSANIGDMVDFKVEFEATNYHGEKQIKYYTIADTKGEALWVEFGSIKVYVNGEELPRGRYHGVAGSHATQEWDYLGNWSGFTQDIDKAQWYLIHKGFDEFDIVIPWLENHDFSGTTNGFSLTFPENAKSVYNSSVKVKITYSAAVEPTATIGGGHHSNIWNEAKLSWTSTTTDGPSNPSTTHAYVYGLGLDKIDGDDAAAAKHTHLSGAVFRIYRDVECKVPVFVIPTDVKGVYILDDLNVQIDDSKYVSARTKYAAYLDSYLNDETQKNEVTTQVNGKLVILGLEQGTYYLNEIQAPNGYNILSKVVTVSVGPGNATTYNIIADTNGNVYDQLEAEEDHIKYQYQVSPVLVENSKGVELPSTGGTGTMMMLSIGTMIAILFAVLLITHKKMSIYHD